MQLKLRQIVFGGEPNPFVKIEKGDGVPSHAAPRIGVIYYDFTNADFYICTVATGTWVKINA